MSSFTFQLSTTQIPDEPSIQLEDNELNCRMVNCGARAGIDGVEFDRKQKVENARDDACNALSKDIRLP